MKPTWTCNSSQASALCLILLLAMTGPTALGASLFGDHSCQSWRSLAYGEKRNWANAFLAPLSLTLKGLHKSKQDKYNDDPTSHEAAVQSIDDFCIQQPDLGAADGAGRYLKKLFEMPPT
jgi:hypothetical protein